MEEERKESLCCRLKCCRVLCEENILCVSLGRVGLPYFDENRGTIMLFATVLNVIIVVLSIIPVVSASFNTDDVQNTAWTYGESNDLKMWIGLNKVLSDCHGCNSMLTYYSHTISNRNANTLRFICVLMF